MTYEIRNDLRGAPVCVARDDGAFVPLVMDNRDFVSFVADWKAGAVVTNADGTSAVYSDAAVQSLFATVDSPLETQVSDSIVTASAGAAIQETPSLQDQIDALSARLSVLEAKV